MNQRIFGKSQSLHLWKSQHLPVTRRIPNLNLLVSDDRLPERGYQVPAIGWRTWRVGTDATGAVLEGAFSGVPWDPDTTHAVCHLCPSGIAGQHPVPAASCECGLYAFGTPDDALRYLVMPPDEIDGGGPPPLVAGAVIGWGRIVQHGSQGWRAQHARPVALLDTDHPMLTSLALRHRVPVVSAQGFRLLPLEYGQVLKG
jgi:hypothetical protein